MKKRFLHGWRKEQGFTMIEMVLTLFVTSLCAVLLAQMVRVVRPAKIQDSIAEDEVAILQLQLVLAQAKEYQLLFSQQLQCNYHGEMISIETYQDKLIKRPGFEVFLQKIQKASFEERQGCITLHWWRDEQEKAVVLGCE